MKTIIIILQFLILLVTHALGQSDETLLLPSINIHTFSNYTIKAQVIDRYVTEYTLTKKGNPDTTKVFTLSPNTPQAFIDNFTTKFKELAKRDANVSNFTSNTSELTNEATRLFYFFIAAERTIEDAENAPDAGNLCFNSFVPVELDVAKSVLKAFKKNVKKMGLDTCTSSTGICQLKRLGYEKKMNKRGETKWKTYEKKKRWKARIYEYYRQSVNNRIQSEIAGLTTDKDSIDTQIMHKVNALRSDSLLLDGQLQKDDSLTKLIAEMEAKVNSANNEIQGRKNQIASHPLINHYQIRATESTDDFAIRVRVAIRAQETELGEQLKDLRSHLVDTTRSEPQVISDSLRQTQVNNRLQQLGELGAVLSGITSDAIALQQSQSEILRLAGEKESLRKAIRTLELRMRDTLQILQRLENRARQKCLELSLKKRESPRLQVKVASIQIEFNDGFMENIVVRSNLQFPEDQCPASSHPMYNFLKFNNDFPIGFSYKNNFRPGKSYLTATAPDGKVYKMSLTDLFPAYVEQLEVDRKDFSPKDYVFEMDMRSGETCQIVKKDETKKLFEAKVYSDFVGLTDDREPNGLVQTEISKVVKLHAKRYKFFIPNTKVNFGFLGSIEPEVTLSKIENNNRRLLLQTKDKVINNQYQPMKYASTLQLRRYQNFSAGLDLNAFLLDFPGGKSTFYFDFGFRYGNTAVRDSLRSYRDNEIIREKLASDYNVNTLYFYPELTWQVRSDERYSFDFTYSHHWLYARDNRFRQVGNLETFAVTENVLSKVSNEYTKIGLYATIKTSTSNSGKLFFRYHFFWQQGYWRTGFHQAQVGYSFFILGNK